MDKFKGLTIELTSKSDIRYKGVLQDIDQENREITLTKVKMLGCEEKDIPASNRIFEVIRFKSGDIKDLVIDEKVEQQEVKEIGKKKINKDSKSSKAKETREEIRENTPTAENIERTERISRKETIIVKDVTIKEPINPKALIVDDDSEDESSDKQSPTRNKGRGAAPRSRGRGRGRGRKSQPQIPKEDFDFGDTDKFQKLSLEENDEEVVEKAYDKQSSFFDSLSSERTTINRQVERNMNMETFGSARVYYPRRRGRGRGRGRSNRGGRGRGSANAAAETQ